MQRFSSPFKLATTKTKRQGSGFNFSSKHNIFFDWENMPVEIILYLASFLNFNDIASLRGVNKHWYHTFFCEITDSGRMRKSANRFTLHDPTVNKNIEGYYLELLELIKNRKELIASQPSLILNLTKLVNEIQEIMVKDAICGAISPKSIIYFLAALFLFSLYAAPESFFIYKTMTYEPTTTCTNEIVPISNLTLPNINDQNESVCNESTSPFDNAAKFYGMFGILWFFPVIFVLFQCHKSLEGRTKYSLTEEQLNNLKIQLDSILQEIINKEPTADKLESAINNFKYRWTENKRRPALLKSLKTDLTVLKKKYTRLVMFQQPRDENIVKRDEIRIKIVP